MSKKNRIVHNDFEFEVDAIMSSQIANENPRFARFMTLAREMADKSDFNRYKIGGVITSKKTILARGNNSSKTHPIQKIYNTQRTDLADAAPHCIHAEIKLLNLLRHLKLKDAEMFIYHRNNLGHQKMARPCPGCMKAIKANGGINRIHYSTPDGFATEYISPSNTFYVNKSRSPI